MAKSCNSVDDCLLAQIINNAALPVKVRTGVSWPFAVPWISNAGLFHNIMVVFNNIYCVLCYLHNGQQEGCFSLI